MTDPTRGALQAALGPSFTLGRELGGGGVSRVFLTRDSALAREIVVKLPSPELVAALGEVALAEAHVSEALVEFRAAANADSGALEAVTIRATATRMARALDKAGQADSALLWRERVAHVRYAGSYPSAPLNLPIAYRRLGELYEARGYTSKALENYRAFTKLWANADAELQPRVREVQQRIAQLVAAEARKR